MFKHHYTYSPEQEGHFIPRARVTFQPFEGCWVVYESRFGWSNYFGSSNVYRKKGQEDKVVETLESFTKSWFVGLDHEDWPILKEISDRKPPAEEMLLCDNEATHKHGYMINAQTKRDLFYKKRNKDIEAYITSKLGWK